MMTIMNTRLQQFLAAENITQAQFADSINVARAGVSHIIAGRNKPGYDFIVNTIRRYPDLNIEWLMTGKGKMYKSASPSVQPQDVIQDAAPALDNLFSQPQAQDEGLFAPQEEDFPPVVMDNGSNNGFSEAQDSPAGPEKKVEAPVRQRKATKIIIFFDDNTFQEF